MARVWTPTCWPPKSGVPPVAVDPARQIVFTTRVCGSPAVDGYAHVSTSCLLNSPTARWYKEYIASSGKFEDMVVHIEPQADYDGLAVVWGAGNTKRNAEECAKQCWQHRPGQVDGPFKDVPCNAFAYCDSAICFEPDAHDHKRGDCWLKFTEAPASPEVNMRGALPDDYRKRHPTAPSHVQWVAGVLLPPGVHLTNGTWSPRWKW
eukprot:jgi/Chrzof1/281/Cz01g09240.t1